jgi:hypothetical protein
MAAADKELGEVIAENKAAVAAIEAANAAMEFKQQRLRDRLAKHGGGQAALAVAG